MENANQKYRIYSISLGKISLDTYAQQQVFSLYRPIQPDATILRSSGKLPAGNYRQIFPISSLTTVRVYEGKEKVHFYTIRKAEDDPYPVWKEVRKALTVFVEKMSAKYAMAAANAAHLNLTLDTTLSYDSVFGGL